MREVRHFQQLLKLIQMYKTRLERIRPKDPENIHRRNEIMFQLIFAETEVINYLTFIEQCESEVNYKTGCPIRRTACSAIGNYLKFIGY